MNTHRTTGPWTLLAASAAFAMLAAACSDDNKLSNSALNSRVVSKLRSCGLLEKSGKFTLGDVENASEAERCEVDCVLNARCEDFESVFCSDEYDEPLAIEKCFDTCSPFERRTCKTEVDSSDVVEFCDGYIDCNDGSDEADCPESAFVDCETEFSEERVPTIAKCDGYEDCLDGEDERGCSSAGKFTCGDGALVLERFKCDGEDDCRDGSDERGCATFACKDGTGEVSLADVCDLGDDCADGSDEDEGCLVISCGDSGSDLGSDAASAPLMSQLKANKAPGARGRAAARRHPR